MGIGAQASGAATKRATDVVTCGPQATGGGLGGDSWGGRGRLATRRLPESAAKSLVRPSPCTGQRGVRLGPIVPWHAEARRGGMAKRPGKPGPQSMGPLARAPIAPMSLREYAPSQRTRPASW